MFPGTTPWTTRPLDIGTDRLLRGTLDLTALLSKTEASETPHTRHRQTSPFYIPRNGIGMNGPGYHGAQDEDFSLSVLSSTSLSLLKVQLSLRDQAPSLLVHPCLRTLSQIPS